MLIPEVLPDEIAPGYLGRLRAINGYRSSEEMVRALRRYFGEQDSGSPVAFLLARALQMPTEAFCRQHTMLPFARAVTGNQPDMKHGAAGSEGIVRLGGMSTPQPGVCLCGSCVIEDIDFWGEAYFRRSHQLPGVPWCEKHQEPLFRVAEKGGFDFSPLELLGRTDKEQKSFSASILDNPAITRYAAIAAHWLFCDRPIPPHQILPPLHKRAKLLGLRIGIAGRKKSLSDHAMAVFPSNWLAGIFPGLLSKRHCETYHPLEFALRNASTSGRSASYALALAMLFDTVDGALNEIKHVIPIPHVKAISEKSAASQVSDKVRHYSHSKSMVEDAHATSPKRLAS
jgi:hypothetical protein